jgi:excisionase family DNA binding protein
VPDNLMFNIAVMSIPEAAKVVGVSPRAIRKAIKGGRLRAFIIGGRKPIQSGAGLGYRIKRRDLQAWYFGEDTLPEESQEKTNELTSIALAGLGGHE